MDPLAECGVHVWHRWRAYHRGGHGRPSSGHQVRGHAQ